MMLSRQCAVNGRAVTPSCRKRTLSYGKSITSGGVTNIGSSLIKLRGIACGRKSLPALFLKIESLHMQEGKIFNFYLIFFTKFVLNFSVSHPFLGDYVRLRQNVQWKKICIETSDQYVVFADIVNKIARSSGKVCYFTKSFHQTVAIRHKNK